MSDSDNHDNNHLKMDIYLPENFPNAIRACYCENNKACGSKFFVLHFDLPSLTIWSRSGHTKTGRGNVTESKFKDEETLQKKVKKMMEERKEREGLAKFVDAKPPASFPGSR